ncbi:MAG: T9SS type A sorting domain-containing protein [Crocinitomicaceae bacterium]|nr:T9SS type A sorting domain-containing protein [Crocinitomicaceae bacterium]
MQEFYDLWINDQLATFEGDKSSAEDFNVYPNPTNGDVFLTIPFGLESELTNVEIFDVTGKLVLTTNFSGQQYLLSLNELQRGSYVMRVTNGTNEFIEKIILD